MNADKNHCCLAFHMNNWILLAFLLKEQLKANVGTEIWAPPPQKSLGLLEVAALALRRARARAAHRPEAPGQANFPTGGWCWQWKTCPNAGAKPGRMILFDFQKRKKTGRCCVLPVSGRARAILLSQSNPGMDKFALTCHFCKGVTLMVKEGSQGCL